jgi:hypothetical protein
MLCAFKKAEWQQLNLHFASKRPVAWLNELLKLHNAGFCVKELIAT